MEIIQYGTWWKKEYCKWIYETSYIWTDVTIDHYSNTQLKQLWNLSLKKTFRPNGIGNHVCHNCLLVSCGYNYNDES